MCEQVLLGSVDEKGQLLAQATRESVWKALEGLKPGACLSDIGNTVFFTL
jgi:methionine aminopeptidase